MQGTVYTWEEPSRLPTTEGRLGGVRASMQDRADTPETFGSVSSLRPEAGSFVAGAWAWLWARVGAEEAGACAGTRVF